MVNRDDEFTSEEEVEDLEDADLDDSAIDIDDDDDEIEGVDDEDDL